jgi:hypothetical protein
LLKWKAFYCSSRSTFTLHDANQFSQNVSSLSSRKFLINLLFVFGTLRSEMKLRWLGLNFLENLKYKGLKSYGSLQCYLYKSVVCTWKITLFQIWQLTNAFNLMIYFKSIWYCVMEFREINILFFFQYYRKFHVRWLNTHMKY